MMKEFTFKINFSVIIWVVLFVGCTVGSFYLGRWYEQQETAADPTEHLTTIDSLQAENGRLIDSIRNMPKPDPEDLKTKIMYVESMQILTDEDELLRSLNELSKPD